MEGLDRSDKSSTVTGRKKTIDARGLVTRSDGFSFSMMGETRLLGVGEGRRRRGMRGLSRQKCVEVGGVGVSPAESRRVDRGVGVCESKEMKQRIQILC